MREISVEKVLLPKKLRELKKTTTQKQLARLRLQPSEIKISLTGHSKTNIIQESLTF